MAHYLITGHTGFKGSWLTMLLAAQGHTVSGVSLEPEKESLFRKAEVTKYLQADIRTDVRDRDALLKAFKRTKPDYVIHLAAQALVLAGHQNPVETYETNILGTLNVLISTEQTDSVMAQLIVTTDKVYRNEGRQTPYVESDPLGGNDPYSASKAAADLLAQERLRLPEAKAGAIARAGNVIGAGDHSEHRLIPDILKAASAGRPVTIRNPDGIRPWQHVLDCLNGYLLLLHATGKNRGQLAWNFGPSVHATYTVADVVKHCQKHLQQEIPVKFQNKKASPEDPFLLLDSSAARSQLRWKERFSFEEAVSLSLASETGPCSRPLGAVVEEQIQNFLCHPQFESVDRLSLESRPVCGD